MDLLTIDFETYYDNDMSLRKMSTEAYVADPRFHIMMVGIKRNDEPTKVYSFDSNAKYARLFEQYDVANNAMLCQNTMFDGVILHHHFGIVPKLLLDTLCMAQALIKPTQRSISLDSLTKNLPLGIRKGHEVHNMVGRTLASLSSAELRKYAEYCKTDCDAEYILFNYLKQQMPRRELQVIDLTLRMYLQPLIELDAPILKGVLNDAKAHKAELMSSLPDEIQRSALMSNPQFAQVLETLGVEVPMKISPTTEKPTYAFAKGDPQWRDLLEEYADDDLISAVLAARMGVKSTIAETRAERLLDIAESFGHLRVPLRYYGAHTGRYGGMEKINCQNLTRINLNNPSRNQLRYALKAPQDHVIYSVDLSQIEVRVTAWLAGCNGLLDVFRRNGDPYCEFGGEIYGRVITKADALQRFVSKTCILGLGFGTGWKTLRSSLRGGKVKASEEEAQSYVSTYRRAYPEIPALWRLCDDVIPLIASGNGTRRIGPCTANADGVLLPNGMTLQYPNMRHITTKKYTGWKYDFAGMGRTMWGGKMTENIVQALARIIIVDAMINIYNAGYRPVLQAHDELVYVIRESEVEEADDRIMEIITRPPSFAPDLPVDAESSWGVSYGDAK